MCESVWHILLVVPTWLFGKVTEYRMGTLARKSWNKCFRPSETTLCFLKPCLPHAGLSDCSVHVTHTHHLSFNTSYFLHCSTAGVRRSSPTLFPYSCKSSHTCWALFGCFYSSKTISAWLEAGWLWRKGSTVVQRFKLTHQLLSGSAVHRALCRSGVLAHAVSNNKSLTG